MAGTIQVKKIGMLGVGSMGSMMTLLLAEKGYDVYFWDPSDKNMSLLEKQAKAIHVDNKVHRKESYDDLCKSLAESGKPKVFLFSTPHGAPADKCVESLKPHLEKGDFIIDCGNEHWENTERRQRDLEPKGIHYIGCGVSGGYQSARSGPSMSPGGDAEALKKVRPFLEDMAAKDRDGRPCTVPVGPGGSGHYVKMVHNGIEQGMMGVMAEVWKLLTAGLGLEYHEVGEIFKAWDAEGPLRQCFLVNIAIRVCQAKGDDGEYVLAHVRDQVVQDVDEEEGTGTWTCEEAVHRHVPAASILASHLFRCGSADLRRRLKNKESTGGGVEPSKIDADSKDKDKFVDLLHRTTYFCFLACFAQGIDLIRKKDKDSGWNLDYPAILQLWRGGCIIQADHIVDGVLAPALGREGRDPDADLLSSPEVGRELAKNFGAAKQVVLKAVAADLFVPTLAQTLEWYKYETSEDLPTQFMEAQLDYFGQHMFDRKDDPLRGAVKGKHHFEWKPAKGIADKKK
ncbi:6-phosphogluconate dehydrogenase [Xylariomycetidae sp. FL2044]|nr:6-phosphogluconate dehydrogenase [Xylariomycetidae sp. FL2044]